MIIRNKIESIKTINDLRLNKFPEQLFTKNNEDKIKNFLNEHPARYYAIRDKSSSGGIFKLKVDYNKVLEEIKEYNLFTINVSSINYAKNQILVGEIEILSSNEVYATLSLNPEYSVRDALNNPDFNFKTDIFDKKLNKIPEFNFIYQYIQEHNLYNVIIEFSLFNKEVGLNNERIIIYELRTNY